MTTGRQTTADCYRTLTFVLVSALLAPAAETRTIRAAEQVVTSEAHTAADVDAAKSTFAQAQRDLKRLVAELSALQAEYQQPNADRVAIEAKFQAARDEARAAASSLEDSATIVLLAEPENATALQIVNDALQVAMETDDPLRVLELAELVTDAGIGDEQILLTGATAAMMVSDLDAAAQFLKEAASAGVASEKIGPLEAALAAERPKVDSEMAKRATEAKADDLPRVRIETSKGTLVVELFENEAPNTVANFISLVEKHFYDDTVFHRVIPQFMAQGGDPTGTGRGGPDYAIACECDLPGARKHFLGTLSMAHAGRDTGGSQFFLTFRPTEHLDGKHTVFGRVIEGLDVLPKIQRTEGPTAGAPDKIIRAEVLRKRDHAYEPKTLPSRR